MRKPYFRLKKRVDKLEEELKSWLGTPFKHHCGVKGVASDCIHHVATVLFNVGAIKKFEIPKYGKDWHMHKENQMIFAGIEREARENNLQMKLYDPEKDAPMDGDIVLYQFGNFNMSHSSLYCRGFGYHSLTGSENMRIRYEEDLDGGKGKKMLIIRLLEEV